MNFSQHFFLKEIQSRKISKLIKHLLKEKRSIINSKRFRWYWLKFFTKARLDIEKLDKILKDNEAIIELSFGNLLEEALTTLDLIENKAIEIKTTNKTMTDDYVIQKAIQNLK